MKLRNKILAFLFTLSMFTEAADVNVVTSYGKTGGIVGVLNSTIQVVNGRTICPSDPTDGCDFGDDPLFDNNGTVNDASDDSYSGDLVVRTNDSFQIIAGWSWNGIAGGTKEKVIIKGTLPSIGTLPNGSTAETKSYKWDTLPGFCLAEESSISEDKQTMICVRKDFDTGNVGTYAEDLIFEVIVKGGTLSGTEPGDITFEVSAQDATTISDDTDGYSLTVTAAPRWNLQKSRYTTTAGYEYEGVKGWLMDYKFYIEVDEVDGETDNAFALLGNESMGADATFTFKDDLSEVSPNAKLIGCSFKGRLLYQNGYVGSADPLTYSGAGSLYSTTSSYDARRISQTADEREITCSKNGSIIDITAKHIDATLSNYPKLDYVGNALPVNRGIAAIGSIYVFVPLDDVKPQIQGGNNPNDEGELATKNTLTDFNPVTPTGNANFGDKGESKLDNSTALTLYYSKGSWDKYYRGTQKSFTGLAHISYYIGSAYRTGDGMVNANTEFSTWMTSNNTGGTAKTEDIHCDVFDGYRLEVQPVVDNLNYNVIKTQYTGKPEWPYRFNIGGDSATYTNATADDFPYDVEYANTYVDDSFLPSRGGDTSADVGDTIVTECTDAGVQWYSSLADARSGINAGLKTVTKIRYTLKTGIEMPSGSYVYLVTNHKIRATDLKTGAPLVNGDLIVDYATHRFNDDAWYKPTYKPGVYPGTHSGKAGDRVIFSGPKVRIIKDVDKVALGAGDTATFNLKLSFTNDTGLEESGTVKVTDFLPKGLKYIATSVTAPYAEPVIGTCADVADISSTDTPCNDAENQVLIWDLGERQAGEIFPDINYSTLVGVEVNAGTIRNVVKIEAPTDASPISQRRSEIGMSVTIPASINIVKSTAENADYLSLRERTAIAKNIDFVMDMRNGKADSITNLDVIDILPFKGDADEGAIKFNTLELKRNIATDFHGTAIFESMELVQHPLSGTVCDLTANGGVTYYFTDADPKTINIAPTVGTANKIGDADSIWCEGDGCIAKADITAVRAFGPRMEAQAICQLKVSILVNDNLAGDNYSNSAGSSATGITLPVLSNSVAVPIVGSSLGDYVWYDTNSDGIQDDNESGISGVTVKLLDASGLPVKNPASPSDDYVVTTDAEGKYSFGLLNAGDYIVEFVKPTGYLISDANSGNSATDSDIVDKANSRTQTITLGIGVEDLEVDAGFYTPIISGNIFDDGNKDGTVNGTKINSADGTLLYVTLLDANGVVLASKAVLADGSYSFDGEDNVTANANYSVILSSTPDATSSSLPDDWNSADGEHIGTDAGLDDLADGKIAVVLVEDDVVEVNFGINKKPVAQNVSEPTQFNPGGEVKVDVPDLNVSDLEDGTPTTVSIKTLPNNAKVYYDGTEVTAGQIIPNFDNSLLTVNPDAGALTVKIIYTTTDKAGVISDDANIIMPFKDLKISGNLFIDGNGNGNIDGSKTSMADGTQLYVTLLDGGTVVASKPLGSGSYDFDIEDGLKANTNYTVVLSESNGSTIPSLPTNWDNNDGENINSISATGNDGSKDGVLTVNVAESDVTLADFGINKKPEAEDVSEPTQTNPGNGTNVQVPDLNISDGQTTDLTVTLTNIPSNGTLYYDGTAVTGDINISNFDNTLLTIDPQSGDQNVSFTYTTTDASGTESDEATVSLEFTNIKISGTLFNDGNGNGDVDGNVTNMADTTGLFVTLVDENGVKVASKALLSDGTYYFDSADGLSPDSNYTVVLTDVLDKPTASLPINWNNADGENIGLVGLDGTADGIVSVNVLSADIAEINFGINKKPLAEDKTEAVQFNPGSSRQVAVPDLNITDKEDGVPTTITVTQLPTNGILYYDGVAVVLDANITDVNLSAFSIDPDEGDVTSIFKYTTTDEANVSSEVAIVTLPFVGLQISGNIFNDGDNDGTVNGTGISAPSAVQLYVTLLDEDEVVIASHKVNADGSYAFEGQDSLLPNTNYKVVLATEANSTSASLPTNWSNLDGEHIGTDEGTDGTNDGMIDVPLATSNVVEVNFGINKKPVAGDTNEPLQLNPGNEEQVTVPDLLISDNEDSTPSTITIRTLPVNGILYYDGTAVTTGQVFNDFNNSLLSVDPKNGDLSVSFTYTTTDAVGDESDVATVSMSFDGLEIKGNIFNDGDNNGTVDGTKIATVENLALYATLLDATNTVMATTIIANDGSYEFTGLDGISPNSDYTVILSTEMNATTPSLPSNWNNADGEHIGTDAGLDGSADGKIAVAVVEDDVVEVNFGINEQPVAINKEEPLQLNPGRDTQVVVPTLEISDNEDGTPATITVTELPTNAILYYNGVAVVLNANISDANLSNFTVDPDNGDLNVTFTYTSTDATGWESQRATVLMPFDGLEISGQVYNDANGNSDIDGLLFTDTYGLPLFANLVDENGVLVSSVAIDSTGSYTFNASTGIMPNTNYTVVLSQDENSTLASLPSTWVYSDSSTNGTLTVTVASTNITEVNFGLNKQPIVANVSTNVVTNPGGSSTVAVPSLDISPNEDGTTSGTTITLTNLPTNGILYYDGVIVSEGQVINNFNNGLLRVDPENANQIVSFNYTVTDDADYESLPARVTIPFSDPDTDGDGITNSIDLDDDNDGILDTVENNTSSNNGDTDGDGIPDSLDLDSDGDGILDLEESNPNPRAVDADANGVLDSTTDADNDGVMDLVGGVTPIDTDNDGQPDFQDVDSDNDGLSDLVEGGTDAALDANTDGVLDNQTDTDADGIADAVDANNGGTPASTPDTDNDAIDNYRDIDSDGDGILDVIEIGGIDANADGQIDEVNTLISGINLPDENTNSIPDVLEIKLQDDHRTAAPNEVVTIDLLENDSGDIDGRLVTLVIPEDFNATARLSTDGKRMIVDGEGEWSVNEKGILTFTPASGFTGSPTPIMYRVTNSDGTKSAVAGVSITVTGVAGISTDQCCDAAGTDQCCQEYNENSVALFDGFGLFFMLFISSLFAIVLIRKEN